MDRTDMITYDAQKLGEKIQNLACVQNPDVTPTQNATYAYEDQKFVVVDEVYGNQIDQAVLADTLGKAITALEPEVDLSKDNCYVQPTVTADSEELKSAVDTMNDYADVKITYEVGAEKEEIPKDTIASWLMTGDDLQVIFNQDLMSSFVSDMAKKYNTYGQAKTLATSYGKTITVPGGNYGWRIDQAGEVAQLMTDIQAKQDVNRDFVYSVRANSRDANDYGNSYVDRPASVLLQGREESAGDGFRVRRSLRRKRHPHRRIQDYLQGQGRGVEGGQLRDTGNLLDALQRK